MHFITGFGMFDAAAGRNWLGTLKETTKSRQVRIHPDWPGTTILFQQVRVQEGKVELEMGADQAEYTAYRSPCQPSTDQLPDRGSARNRSASCPDSSRRNFTRPFATSPEGALGACSTGQGHGSGGQAVKWYNGSRTHICRIGCDIPTRECLRKRVSAWGQSCDRWTGHEGKTVSGKEIPDTLDLAGGKMETGVQDNRCVACYSSARTALPSSVRTNIFPFRNPSVTHFIRFLDSS